METWGFRFPELRFGRGFFGPRRLRNIRCTGTRSANAFSSLATVVARLRLRSGHRAGGTASIIPGYTSATSSTSAKSDTSAATSSPCATRRFPFRTARALPATVAMLKANNAARG